MLQRAGPDGARPQAHHFIAGFYGRQLVEPHDLVERHASMVGWRIGDEVRALEQRAKLRVRAQRAQSCQPIRNELAGYSGVKRGRSISHPARDATTKPQDMATMELIWMKPSGGVNPALHLCRELRHKAATTQPFS